MRTTAEVSSFNQTTPVVGSGFAPASQQSAANDTWSPRAPQALVYKPAKTVTSSAPASRRPWVLEFEPTHPPVTDPLMGWAGGCDPRQHIRLSFPDRDSALAFARRNGLNVTLREAMERPRERPQAQPTHEPAQLHPLLQVVWDRPYWVANSNLEDELQDLECVL
jgi:NADH dehydrogenase ubiquinone Fe-S protein 4